MKSDVLGRGFPRSIPFSFKKSQQGASTVDAPGSVLFEENGVDLGKPRTQTSDLARARYHQQNTEANDASRSVRARRGSQNFSGVEVWATAFWGREEEREGVGGGLETDYFFTLW